MCFPSPLAPGAAQLDVQTSCFGAGTGMNDNTSRVTGRCRNNPNWMRWGMEKSRCKQNFLFFPLQVGFLTVSPGCCQNESQNVSSASPTAGAITPAPASPCWGAVVGDSVSSPKRCCSCTPFCVLLKDDFRPSNPESAQCELDGRICQQAH